MINWQLANRLRSRGVILPQTNEYSCEELQKIAIRQKELMDEFDTLDRIIITKAVEENERENNVE